LKNDSPVKAFLVILLTALVCSSLVSAAVVILRPIQLNNQMLDRSRNIIKLTGLVEEGRTPSDEEMLEMYLGMDVRILDIDESVFNNELSIEKRLAGKSLPGHIADCPGLFLPGVCGGSHAAPDPAQ